MASSTLEKVGTDPCSGRPSGPFSGSRPIPAGISPVPSAAGMIATIGLFESMLTAVIAACTSAWSAPTLGMWTNTTASQAVCSAAPRRAARDLRRRGPTAGRLGWP